MNHASIDPNQLSFEQLADWAKEPLQNRADQASIYLLASRDLIIGGLLLALWYQLEMLTNMPEWTAIVFVAYAGFSGFFVSRLIHEWGHLIPARLMGTLAPVQPFKRVTWLFNYDFLGASKVDFFVSSIGASILHWSAFALLWSWLPATSSTQVGLLCGAFYFSVAGSAIEIPMMLRSLTGMRPYNNWAVHDQHAKRNRAVSAFIALLATLGLYYLNFSG